MTTISPSETQRMQWLAASDDCLLAITDGHPIPTKALQALPPWRAVMLARVAAKAGAPLEDGTADQIHAEAVRVGGGGILGDWWTRPVT